MRSRPQEGADGRTASRGGAVWRHLAALVLVPVVGMGVLGATVVRDRVQEAHRAATAEGQVHAVGQLDAVRSAVDSEVMPTLTLGVLRDEALASSLGFSVPERAALLRTTPQALRAARRATDRATASVAGGSTAATAVFPARAQLTALRLEADARTVSSARLALGYLSLSDGLARAQQTTVTEAGANGLSTRSALTAHDVEQFVLLTQAAGRQLPLLFATRVVQEGEGGAQLRDWLAAWGSYTSLASQADDLSTADLRAHWRNALAGEAYQALEAELDFEALHPADGGLSVEQLVSLSRSSAQRDEAMSGLLLRAVGAAEASAAADRHAATARVRSTLLLELVVLLLSLAAVLLRGRSLSRSLRRLAASAERISRGHLIDVVATGPREVRTVARALNSAVAGLRRVQGQAQAVAAGDLSDALLEQPLPGPLGEVVHASVLQIVTAVRQSEQLQSELAHQAAHDPLTDLPNRGQALRLTGAALHRAQRHGAMTGLLFVDLDHFKAVNDTAGHACGDEVLRVVARRLSAVVRLGDVVCRLGGDEFVVLVEQVGSERDVTDLAERLIAAVSAPIPHPAGGAPLRVGVSVGIAMGRDGGTDADALLAEADTAVYRAKTHGRGRAELFDDALRAELAARSEMEAAITRGLALGELEVHYQPVVDVATGALEGYEALARWQRPGHGTVPPDAFIPVAEGSGLICDLGRWVLGEATRQLAHWRTACPVPEGDPDPTVAVNISGRHLAHPRVLTDVADALAASGLPPHLLVLEITETVLVDDPAATEHLHALRAMGTAIAIDDFGTGYTSIGQLRGMPVDTLKIDRSFVASDEPGHRELVTLIIGAAHTFGLSVVAEGVEDAEQLERLRADACDSAQGYLFSRPLPADRVSALRRAAAQPR